MPLEDTTTSEESESGFPAADPLPNEPKQPPKPAQKKVKLKPSMEDLQAEFLTQIQGDGWQVHVYRRSPQSWQGTKVNGFLNAFNETVTSADLEATYGGGTFQVAVYRPREDGAGGYQAAKWSEMFDIAGPPKGVKIKGGPMAGNGHSADDEAHPSVTKELLGKFSDMTERYVNQAGRRGGGETDMLRLMKETFEHMVADKEREVAAMREDARGGGTGAKLLETVTAHSQSNVQMLITAHQAQMQLKDDQHKREDEALTRQIEAVRTEAERRQRDFTERAERELRDLREDERRERENLTRQHERELTNAKQMLQAQFDNTKSNLEMRITHLERDLTLAKAESNDYKRRAEEAGDIGKQVERMHGLHEILNDTLGGGGGDGLSEALEDAPGWLRGLAGLANTQLGAKIGEGIAGVVTSRGAQAVAAASPQPPRPMLAPSARSQAGMMTPVMPMTQPLQAQPGPPPTSTPIMQPQDNPPDPTIWKVLGSRLEEALDKSLSPVEFAAFVKANVPGPELTKVVGLGLEQIYVLVLQQAAADSAIKSPAGRAYMKAVYEALKASP